MHKKSPNRICAYIKCFREGKRKKKRKLESIISWCCCFSGLHRVQYNGTQPNSLTLCLAWSPGVLEKGSNILQCFSPPALWNNACVCVCVCVCLASLHPHLYRAAVVSMLLGIKCLSHTQSAPLHPTPPHPTHYHSSRSSPFHLLLCLLL